MTVCLGHAVGDERGRAKGGAPGNQTGRELRKSNWYRHDKGWRVFRAKSPAVAQRIADAMRAAIDNPNIGYDQGDRNTLFALAERVGFDPAKVTEPCECDCSSLVRVCCAYAGVPLPSFNTTSEPDRLLQSGAFVELTGEEYTDSPGKLHAGDILVTRVKGHTAIVISGSEASPVPSHGKVRVKGGSVRVRQGASADTPKLFTAHRGETYALLGIADTGWYHIETERGEGYISNRADLTEVIA